VMSGGSTGGTLWQGKRSREAQTADLKVSLDAASDNLKLGIEAESKRAHEAEKRRIYATCLTVSNELSIAAARYRFFHRDREEDEESRQALLRQEKAQDAMWEVRGAVQLIAPPEVINLLHEYHGKLTEYIVRTGEGGPYDKDDPSEIGITRRRMFNAMRVDLGEPGEDLGN
jgi:hypothetical protein